MKYLYLILSIALNIIGQFSLKHGVNLNLKQFSSLKFPEVLTSKYIIIGFLFYGVSALFWIKSIAQINLNVAYPTLAFGYVLVYFLSASIFKEPINIHGVIGVIAIVIGIILIHLK